MFHFTDGLLEADEDGAGDDGVADVELVHVRDRSDRADVVIVEAVAGMQRQAAGDDLLAGGGEFGEFGVASLAGFGQSILAGVKFDGGGAERFGQFQLARIGIEEQADVDTGVAKLLNGGVDCLTMADDVETTFGGNFFAPLGNERGLIGFNAAGDGNDFGRSGQLEI